MEFLEEVARLLANPDRCQGAPAVAQFAGATHLCIFIRDPELDKFLPGPGFPQTLPDGLRWQMFLRAIAQARRAQQQLLSPFTGNLETVFGFRFDENGIAALFGDSIYPDAEQKLSAALRMVASSFIHEVRASIWEANAALAQQLAAESRQLANSLSHAHDKLGESLRAREGLQQEIRRKEQALLKSEKLAAAGRLAAAIAHEINNPLAGLVNLIYLAKNAPDAESGQRFLAMADHELARISAVTRQTLAFYRDSNNPVRFNLCSVVKQVVEIFSRQISTSGLTVMQLCDGHAEIDGWPPEITQVLSNLLINAIYASEPLSQIRIDVKTRANRVLVAFSDAGHGIRHEHLKRIFDPFFSTKRDSGTGLGLWVSRQIVEKHGGSIQVRSRTSSPHRGTIFLICFPVAGSAQFDAADRSLRNQWLNLSR